MSTTIPDELEAELVETARDVVSSNLRSVTYFTEETVEQLYLRDYLEADADLEQFAEAERAGFHNQMEYGRTELDEFLCTVRIFKRGYLVRAVADGHGVFVTLDAVDRDRLEELGTELTAMLES